MDESKLYPRNDNSNHFFKNAVDLDLKVFCDLIFSLNFELIHAALIYEVDSTFYDNIIRVLSDPIFTHASKHECTDSNDTSISNLNK